MVSDGEEKGRSEPVSEPAQAARDKALWARMRMEQPVSGDDGEIDPMELAAYLDGRSSEAEGEALEARLAASAEDLDSLISLRASLSEPAPAAPASLVARAQGIVRAPAKPPHPVLSERLGWLLRPAAWAAASAAVVVLGVMSFQLGQTGYQQFAVDKDREVRIAAAVDETDQLSWRLLDVL